MITYTTRWREYPSVPRNQLVSSSKGASQHGRAMFATHDLFMF